MSLFSVLGVLIGLYTVYAASQGEVHAKSGIRWATITRSESPGYFWIVIIIYAGLSLALMFLF